MNFKKQCKDFLCSILKPQTHQPFSSQNENQNTSIQHSETNTMVVMDNKLLFGKNALITGAGYNIGRGIALEMARQGANIFFTDIDKERCENLERELEDYKVRAHGFQSDISNIGDIDALYNFLVEDKIGIDILVNNVGIQSQQDDIQNLDLADWHKTFNTNVFGPMYLTKHISKMMISNNIQGCILFITSIHQFVPGKVICYSATKGALGMIIKELSLQVASHGIRVNGIAPGSVSEDEQGIPTSCEYAPLHKTSINPCYIGRAAVYLASDYFSKFTTGTVLKIDGGLSLFHYQIVHDVSQ
jgi:NAD(P)-dependent dehydrogenase (short-subunit alcohol dehydrogenase family)